MFGAPKQQHIEFVFGSSFGVALVPSLCVTHLKDIEISRRRRYDIHIFEVVSSDAEIGSINKEIAK